MKSTLLASGVAAALIALADAAVAQTTIRMLSGWPKTLDNVRVAEKFVDTVKARSNGQLNIVISGPEVVPPFEQLDPVSRGAFDLAFTAGAYHTGVTGILMSTDSLKADPALIRSSGVYDWIDRYYQKKANVRVLAIAPYSGYRIVLRTPPDAAGRIDGRKIRGTASYHGVIKELGAAPVVTDVGQIFSGLEKGVIDGYAWPRFAQVALKFYEAGAKYAMDPPFGTGASVILANLDKFAALKEGDRTILIEEARKIEAWSVEFFKDISAKEEAALKEKGVQFVSWGATAGKVEGWFNEGVWKLVAQFSGKDGEDLEKLARSTGAAR